MKYRDKIFNNLEAYSEFEIAKNKKIVFTNGCFDILHPGHLTYLSDARRRGDMLILGLNSDASIKRLKGSSRPINDFDFRATMLSFFPFIDIVIGFEEDTPINLIAKIKPSVLVKGGDYNKDQVVGHELVESYGGKIELIPFVNGFSSTKIIEKINENRF